MREIKRINTRNKERIARRKEHKSERKRTTLVKAREKERIARNKERKASKKEQFMRTIE